MTHRVIGADDVTGQLPVEVEARITNDLVGPSLTTETAARIAGDTANADSLAAETTARVTGDSANAAALVAETAARVAGDTTNANALTAEIAARAAGDTTNANNLTTETAARIAADALLIPLTQKAAANGVATLDGGGKILSSQLPSSVMEYKGVWDAATNAPTLADGSGDPGDTYRVSVAGTRNLGSGAIVFDVGDLVIYDGSIWQRSDSNDAVLSVAGLVGVITAAALKTALSLPTDTAQDITNEVLARGTADTTLQTNINTEAASRISADNTLQTNIGTEATVRAAADVTLQNNITSEASTRASADTANATAIADHIADTTDAHAASAITNTPAGGIAAVTVQAAINELDTEKAPLDSPVLTTPTALANPTATSNGLQLATTNWATPRVTVSAIKTSGYTAAGGDYVRVDTTSGAVTITLPSAPTSKTVVWVAGVAGNNAITVARGGTDTIGPTGATSLTLGVGAENPVVGFQYLSGVWHPLWTRSELVAGDQCAVLATSATGAINLASFTIGQYGGYRLTLTGNVTFSAASKPLVSAGREYEFWIAMVQDATGSRTLTLNANILKPAGMTVTLSTAPGAIDLLKFKWTGTELLLTEFLKGFA